MGNTSTGIPIPFANIPSPTVGPVNPIAPAPPAPQPRSEGEVSPLIQPQVDAIRNVTGQKDWTPEGA